jgi:quinol monooxygenase YgiN
MKILNKNTHKHKFNRRRALECKFVEKSKNNPGYLKYMVTIGEKDGTKHTQPAYGKDMQDALSRLINKERTVKVEKKLESNTGLIFLIWLIAMGTPSFFVDHHTPWFLLYTFGSLILVMVVAGWWYHYIKKGE